MQADLVIEQDDMEFIRRDQAVTIKLDALPHRTFHSTIEEISQNEMKVMPKNLSNKAGGETPTKTDQSGTERPFNTSYQALAPLDDADAVLTIGLKGRAKIATSWQTLGYQAWRYLARTFNFQM